VPLFDVLIQFVFRITFGVALAMCATPARWVSSGFYRVHLWVLMGLNTLASLTIYTQHESLSLATGQFSAILAFAAGLAVLSYFGSVIWLYEQVSAGIAILGIIAAGGLAAAMLATTWRDSQLWALTIQLLNLVTSGILLGSAVSAMFLGHWYLNSPTMELLPFRRLVWMLIVAVVTRGVVNGAGLLWELESSAILDTKFWIFVALRWFSGLIGTLLFAVMTWHTLKIPNTQSATGILYVGVVLTFIGELTSQFLSARALYPL
jgi:hypothetical protein